MLIAQGLGEYGAMSGLLSAFDSLWIAAKNQISQTEPSTWAFVAVGLFIMWFLLIRR